MEPNIYQQRQALLNQGYTQIDADEIDRMTAYSRHWFTLSMHGEYEEIDDAMDVKVILTAGDDKIKVPSFISGVANNLRMALKTGPANLVDQLLTYGLVVVIVNKKEIEMLDNPTGLTVDEEDVKDAIENLDFSTETKDQLITKAVGKLQNIAALDEKIAAVVPLDHCDVYVRYNQNMMDYEFVVFERLQTARSMAQRLKVNGRRRQRTSGRRIPNARVFYQQKHVTDDGSVISILNSISSHLSSGLLFGGLYTVSATEASKLRYQQVTASVSASNVTATLSEFQAREDLDNERLRKTVLTKDNITTVVKSFKDMEEVYEKEKVSDPMWIDVINSEPILSLNPIATNQTLGMPISMPAYPCHPGSEIRPIVVPQPDAQLMPMRETYLEECAAAYKLSWRYIKGKKQANEANQEPDSKKQFASKCIRMVETIISSLLEEIMAKTVNTAKAITRQVLANTGMSPGQINGTKIALEVVFIKTGDDELKLADIFQLEDRQYVDKSTLKKLALQRHDINPDLALAVEDEVIIEDEEGNIAGPSQIVAAAVKRQKTSNGGASKKSKK